MRDATLRLVQPEAGETDALAFERRVTFRQPVTGHVTTVCESAANHLAIFFYYNLYSPTIFF